MRTNLTIMLAAALLAIASRAGGGPYDKYIWETPRTAGIDEARTAPLRAELAYEVQQILDAPPLGPLRVAYGDVPFEAYWLYYERGRIITTLAYAYPHVSPQQQAGIRTYVRNLLASEEQAPWNEGLLPQKYGAERRLYKTPVREGRYVTHVNRPVPTLHVLYGLWLYGDRTGDWEPIQSNWQSIRQRYLQGVPREPILYGQMSAHIAVARMAKRFGDAGTQAAAEAALERDFDEGRDSNAIEQRQRKTHYAPFYGNRNISAFPGMPFMFLDASPEVMRFVADHVKDQALDRIDRMKRRYPLWWVHQAPYGTRWTGDESKGTPPDLFGMVFNVERWVRGATAEELALWLRSAPLGIGDSYWIEGLVQTIEAFGTIQWKEL